MNTLRAILSCLLALSLLASTSGVSLAYHICSGELDSVTLASIPQADTCDCDHDDATTSDAPCTKDCCQTTLHTLKTVDIFTLAVLNTLPKLAIIATIPTVHLTAQYSEQMTLIVPRPHTSPPPERDIPVRFHALLI